MYRDLLNSFYTSVKSVQSSNVVLTAGTAPYGDPPGGSRVPPAKFVRDLLCLKGRQLVREPCPNPAHFDVIAHHPYDFGGPLQRPYKENDVSIPNIWKLAHAVDVAVKTGRALPRASKPLWVTEFAWSSDPPQRGGVPLSQWCYWIERAFYELWSQGVEAVTWLRLADGPPGEDFFGAGVYSTDGREKPGFEAFRFPFLVQPPWHTTKSGAIRPARNRGRVVWGISPQTGTVEIQQLRSHRWHTIARFQVGAHEVFTRRFEHSGPAQLRAKIGNETSLIWRIR